MTKQKKKSRGSTASSKKSDTLQQVVREIRKGKSFLVTTHANPDGDALGSALALGAGLMKLGKKVKIYNKDTVPRSMSFLPNSNKVTQVLNPDEKYDAAFIVDCADKERVSDEFVNHKGIAKLIVLDHHRLSGRAGDINLIEINAASSGMVVHKVLKALRVPITKDIATAVYTTLVTDTGCFSYSNTNTEVMKLAYELLKTGVSPWQIAKNLFESFPVERLKIMGRVLNTLEISPDRRYAWLTLTKAMLDETGATKDLAEGFISYARSIDTVEVAVQFRESEEGWKVSFRSKDHVDVAKMASQWGGGGHARAAGCTFKGNFDLEDVRGKVLEAVRKSLEA